MKQNEGGHCNISGMSARSGGRLAHDKVVSGGALCQAQRGHTMMMMNYIIKKRPRRAFGKRP